MLFRSGSNFALTKVASDSYWETNDIVRIEGRKLSFLRRADRLVKVLGELVDPDEIAQFFHQYDASIQIETLDDERMGKRLVAVGPNEAKLNEAMTTWNAENPGFKKVTESIVMEIPLNEMGKINRRRLREEISGDRG